MKVNGKKRGCLTIAPQGIDGKAPLGNVATGRSTIVVTHAIKMADANSAVINNLIIVWLS